jgi:hypothetical protein
MSEHTFRAYQEKILDRIEFIKHVHDFIYDPQYIPNVLEMGVLSGGYSDLILKVFDKVNLYLVDTWNAEGNDLYFSKNQAVLDSAFEQVKAKFSHRPLVTIIPLESAKAAEKFKDGFFNWVYIDANHTKEAAARDIKIWLPKVEGGGVISGHDFDPDLQYPNSLTFGVNEAVKEAFGTNFGLTEEEFYKSWYHVIPV